MTKHMLVPPHRFTLADCGCPIPVCNEPYRWVVRDLRAAAEALCYLFVPNAIRGRSEAHLLVDFVWAHAGMGGHHQHHGQPHRRR